MARPAMKRVAIAFGVAASFACCGCASIYVDETCSRLHAFEHAAFSVSANGKPVRRWIEFHWIGAWLDFDKGFSWKCLNSDSAAAKTLCEWLIDNTSIEFQANLPLRIMKCYGYRTPDFAQWSEWKAETELHGKDQDRFLRLEIDQLGRASAHAAIRLSVIPYGWNDQDRPPDALIDNSDNPAALKPDRF